MKNIKNNRYGRLLVVDFIEMKIINGRSTSFWLCKCDCGKSVLANISQLNGGYKKSCGCLQTEGRPRAGDVFGLLKVIEECEGKPNRNRRGRFYRCHCVCGRTTIIEMSKLKNKERGCRLCSRKNLPHTGRRLPDKEVVAKRVFYTYRNNAKEKGREFSLSISDFESIIFEACFYCGSHPSMEYRDKIRKGLFYNGVDRLNNSLGYTMENTVPCCTTCNFNKRSQSYSDFIAWIQRSYKNLLKRGIINDENKKGESHNV